MEILKLLNSFFQEKRQSKQYFYALKYSNKEIFSIKKKHNNSFDMQVLFSQPFPKLPLNFVCHPLPQCSRQKYCFKQWLSYSSIYFVNLWTLKSFLESEIWYCIFYFILNIVALPCCCQPASLWKSGTISNKKWTNCWTSCMT